MGYAPLKHEVTDEGRRLTRPWTLWVELVQRLVNDVQTRTVSGTATTIDWLAGDEYHLTLTADCTLTFVNPIGGGRYVIVVEQDATGGHTVTWPTTVSWPDGVTPTLTTTPGALDLVELVYLATVDRYVATISLNY